MQFLSSVFLGSNGSYHLGKVEVTFTDEVELPEYAEWGRRNVAARATQCVARNRVFNVVSLGYLHNFVHEMGHALASRLLTEGDVKVRVYTRLGAGEHERDTDSGALVETIVALAGPLAGMALSNGQLIGGAYLWRHVGRPVGAILGVGGALWMCGEALICFISAVNNDDGDFRRIRKKGIFPLAASSALLMGAAALGIFGSLRILK